MPVSWDETEDARDFAHEDVYDDAPRSQGRRPEQEASSEAAAAWCLAILAMLLVGRLILWVL